MSILIPAVWLVPAVVKSVKVHWTAGTAIARQDDADHYHAVLNQDLTLLRGKFTPKDQESTLEVGKYAAHTKGSNRFAFGYSLAGMRLAEHSPFKPGPEPITEPQWSRAMIHLAQICLFYRVPVTDKTLLTHAEVQTNLGIQQKGKWDIAVLPWQADKFNTAKAVGDLMRAEVRFIMEKGLPK